MPVRRSPRPEPQRSAAISPLSLANNLTAPRIASHSIPANALTSEPSGMSNAAGAILLAPACRHRVPLRLRTARRMKARAARKSGQFPRRYLLIARHASATREAMGGPVADPALVHVPRSCLYACRAQARTSSTLSIQAHATAPPRPPERHRQNHHPRRLRTARS